MEEILSRPPGLPRENPTSSYWQMPPDDIANFRTTEALPGSVDIIIIGSGISGATIAYNLLSNDPDLVIVLLEARQAASGASGRNGGHTKHASYRKFAEDIKEASLEDAVKIANLEYDCMVAVHDFIKHNGIDCDGHRCDTVDVYYNQEQFDNAKESVQLMKQHIGDGSPVTGYKFYGSEETATKFLTPDAVGSLTYEAGSLSAYRLTIGILKLALSKGLNLQTNTPAQSIKKTELQYNLWTVSTPRGEVTAPKLILATNGYTAHLYPKLQGTIVPFRGVVTAHRPGSRMPQTGLDHTYSFVYDTGYDYMITRQQGSTHQGDIVIGGGLTKAPHDGVGEFGNTDDTTADPAITSYLTDSTSSFFASNWGHDHPEGRVRHTWSGIMGYSADGYPLVGEMPGEQGLWIDASFQGHGMVLCFLCAKAVADMVLGRDGPELDKWFPSCFRVTEKRIGIPFKALGQGVEEEEEKEKEKEKEELSPVKDTEDVAVNGLK